MLQKISMCEHLCSWKSKNWNFRKNLLSVFNFIDNRIHSLTHFFIEFVSVHFFVVGFFTLTKMIRNKVFFLVSVSVWTDNDGESFVVQGVDGTDLNNVNKKFSEKCHLSKNISAKITWRVSSTDSYIQHTAHTTYIKNI